MTLKTLLPNQSKPSGDAGGQNELLRASLAALLVIIVLLQMDPADAQISKPSVLNDPPQVDSINR